MVSAILVLFLVVFFLTWIGIDRYRERHAHR